MADPKASDKKEWPAQKLEPDDFLPQASNGDVPPDYDGPPKGRLLDYLYSEAGKVTAAHVAGVTDVANSRPKDPLRPEIRDYINACNEAMRTGKEPCGTWVDAKGAPVDSPTR